MSERAFVTPIGQEGIYILDTASWRTVRPVMDKEKCVDCGFCLAFCPVFAVKRDSNKKYYISYDYCKGCGICAHECPKKAISMMMEGECHDHRQD